MRAPPDIHPESVADRSRRKEKARDGPEEQATEKRAEGESKEIANDRDGGSRH